MTRKSRRPVDTKPVKNAGLSSAADIPLARPKIEKPEGKTLYELAAERQAQLANEGKAQPVSTETLENAKLVTISLDGTINEESSAALEKEEGDEPANPIFDTIFFALPLSALHFTLSVLTMHQYAQELEFRPLVITTVFVALPTLILLIHLLHGHLFPAHLGNTSPVVKEAAFVAQQILFILVANVSGCYLIYLTNDRGYYAVMKKAPSIGTVWVWCVLELGLVGALAGVVGPGIYAWWNGYGVW